MEKRYRILLAARVRTQFLRHVEFLSRVSIAAAKQLRNDFKSTLLRLMNNPYQFPIDIDLNPENTPYRKAIFGKRYKLLFIIDGESVFVDSVADCRQEIIAY